MKTAHKLRVCDRMPDAEGVPMPPKTAAKGCFGGFFFVFFSKRFRRQFWKVYGLFSPDTNSVIEIIIKTCNNKTNDNINDLLASANLPLYTEHYRLSDFNTSCLSEEDQEKYEELSKLSFLHSVG